MSLSWLLATAAWTTLSTDTCSRTSEIWPWAARVTSISSSIRWPRRPTWRSRISRRRTRIGLLLLERAQHAGGVGDRRERIAQLVREHRQELALAPLGQAQLLGALGERLLELLPLVDVDAAADVADRGAVGADARHAVVEHPAVLAVVAAQRAGPSRTARAPRSWWRGCRGSGRGPRDGRARVQPSPRSSSDGAAGVGAPRRAEPVVAPVEAGAPDQDRRGRDAGEPSRASAAASRSAMLRLGAGSDRCDSPATVSPGLPVASRTRNLHASGGNRHAAASGSRTRRALRQAPRRRPGGRPGAGARPRPPSAAGGTW